MKCFDDSMLVRTVSNLHLCGNPKDGTYIEGEVLTYNGIVQAYAEDGHSALRFVHKGRLFIRSFKHRYTELGLVRLAAKFAKEKSK